MVCDHERWQGGGGAQPMKHSRLELYAPVTSTDHQIGAPHAPVTVVEYGDFECPNCKQAAPAARMLLRRFPDQVQLVFRHFPLEDVHPHALLAAETAECAGAQGKFWEMHDVLFENQLHLDIRHLRRYVENLDLDLARYTAELDDHIYLQKVRENLDSGRRSGVRGTPGFFVNGMIQDVSFGLHALFDATAAILASKD
jgi:protein-disulfide isomerase